MDIVENIAKLSKEVERLSAAVERYGNSIDGISTSQDKMDKALTDLSKAGGVADNISELSDKCKQLTNETNALGKTSGDIDSYVSSMQSLITKQEQLLSSLGDARKQAISSGDARSAAEFTESIAMEQQQLEANRAALQQATAAKIAYSDATRKAVEENGNFTSTLSGGVKFTIANNSSDISDKAREEMSLPNENTFNEGAFAKIDSATSKYNSVNTALSEVNQSLSQQNALLSDNAEAYGKLDTSNSNIAPVTTQSTAEEVGATAADLEKQKNNLDEQYELLEQQRQIRTEIDNSYREGIGSLNEAYLAAQKTIAENEQKSGDEQAQKKVQEAVSVQNAVKGQLQSINKDFSKNEKACQELTVRLEEIKDKQREVGEALQAVQQIQRDKQLINFDTTNASAETIVGNLSDILTRIQQLKDAKAALSGENDDSQTQIKALEDEKAKTEKAITDADSGNSSIIPDSAAYAALKVSLDDINTAIDAQNEKVAQAQARQAEYDATMQQLTATADACSAQLNKMGVANPFDAQNMSVEELKKGLEQTNNEYSDSLTKSASIRDQIAGLKQEQERVVKLQEEGKISEEEASKQLDEQKKKLKEANTLLDAEVKKQQQLTNARRAYKNELDKKEEKDTGDSSNKNISIGKDGVNFANTAKDAELLSKGLSQVSQGFAMMGKGGASAVKGLSMVAGGVKMVSKALLSLLANPIVLLIAAIVTAFVLLGKTLSAFFTKTEEGQAKFAKWKGVFEGVKASLEQLAIEIGRKVSEIGDVLIATAKLVITAVQTPARTAIVIVKNTIDAIKNAFQSIKKGDFDGVGNALKQGFDSIGIDISNVLDDVVKAKDELVQAAQGVTKMDFPNIATNVTEYQKLTAAATALEKERRQWETEKAKLDQEISENQEVMYSGSRVEQLRAIEKSTDLTNQKYNKELELAKEDLRIKTAIVTLAGRNATIEQIDAQGAAQEKVYKIEMARNQAIKATARRYKSLTDTIANLAKQQEETIRQQQIKNETQKRDNEYQAELSFLQKQLKYETDITKQLELQKSIKALTRQHDLQALEAERKNSLQQLEKDKVNDIRTNYGDAAVKEYNTTGTLKDDSLNLLSYYNKKVENTNKQYDLKAQGLIDKSIREEGQSELDLRLQNYTTYCEQTLANEEKYQQQLAEIRERYNLAEDTDLSQFGADTKIGRDVAAAQTERDTQQAIINRSTGISGNTQDTEWVQQLATLGEQVAGKSMEEIRKVYNVFIREIQTQINDLQSQMDFDTAALNEQKGVEQQATAQLADVNAQLDNGENLTEEERAALLEQRAALEERIAQAQARQVQLQAQLSGAQVQQNKLVQARTKAETIAANTTAKAATTSQQQSRKTKSATESVKDSLAAVRDAADAVADTFGGAMSKKAKKAVSAISQIADFGISAINSIESVVSGTSQAMTATTGAASQSMSALEKASLILTIISVAVQLVMKIVDIAKQFTESAQMQDTIDEQSEKVENLKHQQELLERAYQNEVGTEYYKKMAEGAKNYSKQIAEQNKLVQQAFELYMYNKNKYAEDSDKVKDAKEQYDNAVDDLADFTQTQIDQYNELMESLSGTSLTSFSESLADALIEGFENGKEGINDVWEDTMDDLMRTMMKQQLALAIQDMFEDTFKKLNTMTSNGDLTQSEIDEIMSEFDAKSAQAKYLAEKYYDLMSERGLLDDADTEGSEGFGQMTQDQADTLTARFTALQIEGANISQAAQALVLAVTDLGADSKLNVQSLQQMMYNSSIAIQVAQEQLDQLQVIADNTALLKDTNDRLKAIAQNTSRL